MNVESSPNSRKIYSIYRAMIKPAIPADGWRIPVQNKIGNIEIARNGMREATVNAIERVRR